MKKKIQIQENEAHYIQKLFFEYEAVCKILKYLMITNNSNKEIDFYYNDAIKKFAQLELAKTELVTKYGVEANINYIISFDEVAILTKI